MLHPLDPSSGTNRLIESSLGSVATKLNFFIHNLAQMKFAGSDDRLTLSFAPRTHTIKNSGRITSVFLCRHEKVFQPSKGYVSLFPPHPSHLAGPAPGVLSPLETLCSLPSAKFARGVHGAWRASSKLWAFADLRG